MPIITLLQDALMVFKGPYERYVGRHTIEYCKCIGRQKLPEGLRQTLLVSAVSADEVIAALLKVDNRRDVTAFIEAIPKKKPKPQLVKYALKAYMSALLVIFGTDKQQLLSISGKNEQEFLDLWIHLFSYHREDMIVFNDLLRCYQQEGIQGLSRLLMSVTDSIWEQPAEATQQQIQFFVENLAGDAATLLSKFHDSDPNKTVKLGG